jgi:hypothetical protein
MITQKKMLEIMLQIAKKKSATNSTSILVAAPTLGEFISVAKEFRQVSSQRQPDTFTVLQQS